ncbi:ABC transporter permease [Salmonella bongori]|nr:ABC transporter permease [Salmonella bongori]
MPVVKPEQIRTPWREFWRRFRRQHVALSAGGFVLALILVAIFARWLTPYDAENYFDYDSLNNGPSLQHWFGVDSLGRDIFSRVLRGGADLAGGWRICGTYRRDNRHCVGLLAGYYEGWWDRLTMRICDVLFAFPGILLAIAVVAVLGSGIANVIVAVAIFSIPAFARLVRGNTLVLKQQTFIESARSIGASDVTILFSHILPGTVSSIVVYFTMRIGTSIISARQSVVSRIRRAATDAGVGSDAQ